MEEICSMKNKCLTFLKKNKKLIIFSLVLCTSQIGCNFCVDIPGALETSLYKIYGISASQFALFYSLYFVPTIITNTIGGYLIDRLWGIKLTTAITALLAVIGMCIFAAGGLVNSFPMMLLGRLIFGLGNELATGVCTNWCMFTWYKHVMNFMSVIFVNMNYIGTLIVYELTPVLLRWLEALSPLTHAQNLGLTILINSLVIWPTTLLAILMTFLGPSSNEEINNNRNNHKDTNTQRTPSFSDFTKFPKLFWMLCLFTGTLNTLVSFQSFSEGLLIINLKMSPQEVSVAIALLTLTRSFAGLPIALIVDRIGRNISFVSAATLLAVIPQVLLLFNLTPYLAMFMTGTSQSIASSSSLTMYGFAIEDKSLIGLGYGIVSSVMNFSLFITPIIVGCLIDRYGVKSMKIFYMVSTSVSFGLILLIWITDKNTSNILNMSAKERNKLDKRVEASQDEEYSNQNAQKY